MLASCWAFLSDADNQATLAWLGGGFSVAIGGICTLLTYLRRNKPQQTGPQLHTGTPIEQRNFTTGIEAGGDIHINGPPIGNEMNLSKRALALAALGLLLIIYGVLSSGDRVSVENGIYIGGNQENSDAKIEMQGQAEQ